MSVTIQLRTLVAFTTCLAVALIAVFVFRAWRVDAAPGDSDTTFVPITPCRLIDTRPAPDRVGPHGAFGANDTKPITARGNNGDCTDIPTNAVGLSLNVTAVGASQPTFLTFWPDGTKPKTSNLNPAPGQPPTPNAITTKLSASGNFNVYNLAGTVNVIIDINGYHTRQSLQEISSRLTALEAAQTAAVAPAQVIWVATSGGDFTLLSTALASIADASASKPYVIKIAAGVYNEAAPVALKDHVDVEGSGQDVTTITCACGGSDPDGTSAVLSAGPITSGIRHLTIANTGGTSPTYSSGIYTINVVAGSLSLLHVTATATGGTNDYAVLNLSSSPSMNNVTATATGSGSANYAVHNLKGSSPSMNNVTATSTGSAIANYAVVNRESSPLLNNVTATSTGGTANRGMFNISSSPTIRNSSITGSTNSIFNSSSTAMIASTTLDGVVNGGGFSCVGVHDAAFNAVDTECI